ncbi:hypothetical protein NO263_03290 [Gluconacetobacter entanii]|uniref:C2H2-type domain-containing protein n=1 Tax=Gluconacetobacter entanii TaxID=108528 RepID=A0ABT3K2H4_9PROT|nr:MULTISPECIES: hypothetical protein [Acetobacteraceae]MCW4589599.1 hypothetical protein [Gluconacetobacter entanii]MCW4593025.1 hypothetical protein [Gluconacetobacter entanii]NPC89195.1 hypothetical protein [Gluconacetobacter entanii]
MTISVLAAEDDAGLFWPEGGEGIGPLSYINCEHCGAAFHALAVGPAHALHPYDRRRIDMVFQSEKLPQGLRDCPDLGTIKNEVPASNGRCTRLKNSDPQNNDDERNDRDPERQPG